MSCFLATTTLLLLAPWTRADLGLRVLHSLPCTPDRAGEVPRTCARLAYATEIGLQLVAGRKGFAENACVGPHTRDLDRGAPEHHRSLRALRNHDSRAGDLPREARECCARPLLIAAAAGRTFRT